jgi:murein DD-endopeptidase MepM/ murein hydrolase activator NlpD
MRAVRSRLLWPTLAAFILLLSCTHFQKPDYVSAQNDYQSGFSTSEEILDSPEVKKFRSQGSAGPFQLQWPVSEPKVNRGFMAGADGSEQSGRAGREPSRNRSRKKSRRGRHHLGLDLGGPRNTPIYAAHDGVVIYAGSRFRGYGRMILLEYDGTWATLYGHLNGFNVKTGARVQRGQKIGTMGRTGRATGVHLHFELIRDKVPVDPMPYLQATTSTAAAYPLSRKRYRAPSG